MRKITTAVICFLFTASTFGQVFNTAEILKKGKISLGLNPAYYNDNLGLFIHGNIGILSGVDFSLKYGFLDGADYFGGDLEWKIMSKKPSLSLTTGAHYVNDIGLDCSFNISTSITKGVNIYTGADSDLELANDIDLVLWIPVGVDLRIKSKLSFIFEAEIPVTNSAFAIIDGGIVFYFN